VVAFDAPGHGSSPGDRLYLTDLADAITERLEQCCVHVGSAGSDPVRMPFCVARLFPKVRVKAMEGAVSRAAVTADRR